MAVRRRSALTSVNGWRPRLTIGAEQYGFARMLNGHRYVAESNILDTVEGIPLGEFQFFADLTVTFHSMKPCHSDEEGSKRCGKTVVKDIGL